MLSGYPHLEEAYWFGEGVTPELARRGLLSTVPASPSLSAARGRENRPASAPGGAPLLVAGGR
ncbi:Alkanesulfonate monooxygenase OS=Streptomyces sp. ACT-1 OX=1609288 GN=SACT1_6675 PE=4 SV=1 [Streptomyces griseus subsp. griseus]